MALFDNVRMGKRPNASQRRDAGVSRSAAAEVERAVVLRRCAEWRKAFSGAEVVYPADALSYPPAAQWIRQRGLCVEARSAKGLALTVSAGIRPGRVVFRCAGAASPTISNGVGLGFGQFIVASHHDIATLGACAQRPQRVLVDVTTEPVDDLAAAILADGWLDLVGVHSTIDGADAGDAVERALEQMSYLRHHDGVIMTRLYLAVERPAERALHSLAGAICDAVDEACARYRFPLPEHVVAPDLPTVAGDRVA